MAYSTGQIVPQSGIYRCHCGKEVTCVKGEPFPPCTTPGCRGAGHFTLVRPTR